MYEERVEELCRNGCKGLKEWAESQERRAKMNRCSCSIAYICNGEVSNQQLRLWLCLKRDVAQCA